MNENFEEISVDKRIGKILDELISNIDKRAVHHLKNIKEFCYIYSKKGVTDLNWIDICNDAHNCKKYKFCASFLVELLNSKLYTGCYADELYKNIEVFNNIINKKYYSSCSKIFCYEKIKGLIIIENYREKGNYLFFIINGTNPFLKEILQSFLNCKNRKFLRNILKEQIEYFEESLGTFKDINTYKDFNGNTLFTQIDFYKNKYKSDLNLLNNSINFVIFFYRWLCNEYNEHNFFEKSFNMTTEILFKSSLIKIIKNDYKFILYNPYNNAPKEDKICFILNGFQNYSSRMTNSATFLIDVSDVKNEYYKYLIKTYLIKNNILKIGNYQLQYIIDALKFLLELKNQKDYPNKDFRYLTNQESVLLRRYFISKKQKISTTNNRIGSVRRFLNWTKDNNYLSFDDMFFDYLKQYEEPTINTANAIPDDKLMLLNNYFLEKAKQNIKYQLIYVIFHLAIQAEFRVNEICHLKIDCISPSIKPNQYIVKSTSKSSHGHISEFVISNLTYKILKDVIEATEPIRNACHIKTLKDYIFIYNGNYNSTMLMNAAPVSDILAKACKKLGFDKIYNSSNLRDTHMTKSFEYILRNKKSNIELSILSKHKCIDTTKNHYIEIELEKMLEATYGIIIGEEYIETSSKIVEKIPKELEDKQYDVENGCGKCTAESCEISSSLPCLTCKYFITTIKHEVFFKKEIERIDELIKRTTNTHDREDLVTIKKLYILYLKSIYEYKEIKND